MLHVLRGGQILMSRPHKVLSRRQLKDPIGIVVTAGLVSELNCGRSGPELVMATDLLRTIGWHAVQEVYSKREWVRTRVQSDTSRRYPSTLK